MVIAHPATKKPELYVNCLHTREIIDMEPRSAVQVLDELFAATERPDLIYAHKWRKGDLLIWDNRCLQHGRSDWEPRERRLMRRFAVKCEGRPQPYAQALKNAEVHA
jgi:taurine dioxygenase